MSLVFKLLIYLIFIDILVLERKQHTLPVTTSPVCIKIFLSSNSENVCVCHIMLFFCVFSHNFFCSLVCCWCREDQEEARARTTPHSNFFSTAPSNLAFRWRCWWAMACQSSCAPSLPISLHVCTFVCACAPMVVWSALVRVSSLELLQNSTAKVWHTSGDADEQRPAKDARHHDLSICRCMYLLRLTGIWI